MKKKKEKEYLTINSYTMEVIHKQKIDTSLLKKWGTYKALELCYNKPSYTKQDIYFELVDSLFIRNNDIKKEIDFGVASYNSNIFTFNSDYIDNNGIFKQIHITPTHNYITIYDL